MENTKRTDIEVNRYIADNDIIKEFMEKASDSALNKFIESFINEVKNADKCYGSITAAEFLSSIVHNNAERISYILSGWGTLNLLIKNMCVPDYHGLFYETDKYIDASFVSIGNEIKKGTCKISPITFQVYDYDIKSCDDLGLDCFRNEEAISICLPDGRSERVVIRKTPPTKDEIVVEFWSLI